MYCIINIEIQNKIAVYCGEETKQYRSKRECSTNKVEPNKNTVHSSSALKVHLELLKTLIPAYSNGYTLKQCNGVFRC